MILPLPSKAFIIRTAILVLLPTAVAVTVNAVRPTPLEWVAEEPYEIFQDCPEATKTAGDIPLKAIVKNPNKFLFVDARSAGEFAKEHVRAARSLPYDPIFPVSKGDIARLFEAAGSRTVVVIGDGRIPKLMADDLMTQGFPKAGYLPENEDWRELLDRLGRETK